MDNVFIVAGLGNPGSRFENTRHNVGFETVDVLAEKYGINIKKLKHKALIGDGRIGADKVILVKPQTYMNLSGDSIREIIEWYKTPVENLIIIYDDIDLPLGKLRIRPKGSSGTHNGMKSVIYQLQSDEFPRVRIGIGSPPENYDMVDYVIGRFTDEERNTIDKMVKLAAEAVEEIIKAGIDPAMNKYNRSIGVDK
ncbi:MAG: aminoacyl-tRNA hydrolase [Acetivibrionales bacterium]|jgi:PTH1 family peptidyl-tRNA hydrolase